MKEKEWHSHRQRPKRETCKGSTLAGTIDIETLSSHMLSSCVTFYSVSQTGRAGSYCVRCHDPLRLGVSGWDI